MNIAGVVDIRSLHDYRHVDSVGRLVRGIASLQKAVVEAD